MLDRLSVALYCAYSNVKIKLMKLAKEESGMETLEVVILIAVAVIIAAVLINFLTGDAFTIPGKTENGGKGGLIEYIFTRVKEQIDGLFKNAPGTSS